MHFVNIIQSPFGPVLVAYTGAGHVAVLTNHETGPIQVPQNRSSLSLNLHLYRDEAGQFAPKDPDGMILSKYQYRNFNYRDATPTARKAVLKTLPPLVTEFLKQHEAECLAEDVEDVIRQIGYNDKDIAKLEEQLVPLKEKRKALESSLAEARAKV